MKRFLLIMTLAIAAFDINAEIPKEIRSKGFVYLHEVDPSIKTSLRYHTNENFLGKPVNGYNADLVIMTKPTALALKSVQTDLKKDGYELVVYDAYRPQHAVDHFVVWADDIADQIKKESYYPRIDKARVFELDYVAKRSGHSRGSTVDLTIMKIGNQLHPVKPSKRTLRDGFTFTYLDDGTVDMGSSFDLFDKASHYENDLVLPEHQKMRAYLKSMMEKHAFKNYYAEWWHFTLKNEPFTNDKDESYFDFKVD